MKTQFTIEDIKDTHEKLYEKVLQKHQNIKDDLKLQKKYMDNIEELLDNIKELSMKTSSIKDYAWLSNASMQWQVVFSSVLNIPRNVQIDSPKQEFKSPYKKSKSTSETLKEFIKKHSYMFFRERVLSEARVNPERLIARYISTESDQNNDLITSKRFLAHEILVGNINFAYELKQKHYREYLEKIWLKDVKELMAYFNWTKRRDGFITEEGDAFSDYEKACKEIRSQLVKQDIKASASDFIEIKNYLETLYLDRNGKVDITKSDVHELIIKKRDRICETTGKTNKDENWYRAESYVRFFYENIISAVMKKDEKNIAKVLKAFQFSKAQENRFLIINCFEAAIAIYFLDKEIIENLWNNPDLTNFSMVPVEDWQEDLELPPDCVEKFSYDKHDKLITYEGTMTKENKKSLLQQLKKEQYKDAIEKLFNQSRLNPQDMTL